MRERRANDRRFMKVVAAAFPAAFGFAPHVGVGTARRPRLNLPIASS